MNCLIFLLICCVAGGLTITTVPSVTEQEMASNFTQEVIKVDELETTVFPKTRQNEIDDELVQIIESDDELADDQPAVEVQISEVTSTTQHFTLQACPSLNMEWNSCGPRCYQTCAFQPRDGRREARAVCESASSTNCYAGCFCKSGYVRINDHCVLPVDCPTRACVFANEEYKQCGTPCQLTCDSYSQMAEIENRCPSDICVRGCFCKPGYVRSATGLCVLPTRCPRPIVV